METELFFGSLTILTMAAIIIAALTTNRRNDYNEHRHQWDAQERNSQRREDRR